MRRLLGLEDVISLGLTGPTHDQHSWTFDLDPGGVAPVLGIERLQDAYDKAYDQLFDRLDWLSKRLSTQRYLVGDTIDFDQIKEHYYVVHRDVNPTQIVPKGPDLSNWHTAHGREALGGRPFGDGTAPQAV